MENAVKEYLVNNGMFDSQAAQVIELMKANMPEMSGRWCEPADAHPQVMLNILIISAKRYALQWIEENMPMAWYKPMFQQFSNKKIGETK